MSMYNLLATLSGAEIDYVLIGGLAVTLHGYQRVTMDVDVVLSMNDANLAKFVDCAKAANLKPVLPIPIDALRDASLIDLWHREKGMLAFALRSPGTMGRVELTPEENLRLLEEIEANRAFILLAYQSNPELLKVADPQIRRLSENPSSGESDTW